MSPPPAIFDQAYIDARSQPEPNSGCLIWLGAVTVAGYGEIHTPRPDGSRARMGAHRVALQLATRRPIPKGKIVCHKCDTPSCVNPDHLFLGSDADNSRDCVTKGRSARGVANGHAKLTNAKVATIRARFAAGWRQVDIVREFGVSKQTINGITRGRDWSHVPEAPKVP